MPINNSIKFNNKTYEKETCNWKRSRIGVQIKLAFNDLNKRESQWNFIKTMKQSLSNSSLLPFIMLKFYQMLKLMIWMLLKISFCDINQWSGIISREILIFFSW